MRELPRKCLRNVDDCGPLCQIVSDDKTSFICCGLNFVRNVKCDIYRTCFKTVETDSMYDMDEFDMLDVAEMQIRAITTQKRLKG
jgi:hypothetical protein